MEDNALLTSTKLSLATVHKTWLDERAKWTDQVNNSLQLAFNYLYSKISEIFVFQRELQQLMVQPALKLTEDA